MIMGGEKAEGCFFCVNSSEKCCHIKWNTYIYISTVLYKCNWVRECSEWESFTFYHSLALLAIAKSPELANILYAVTFYKELIQGKFCLCLISNIMSMYKKGNH